MRFGTYLTGKGLVATDQVMEALDIQLKSRIPIGKLAMEAGKLTAHQVFEVLNVQTENRKPFGQIAVELGYLSALDLTDLLTTQRLRNKPIGQILVDMGAIEREVLEEEYLQFRRIIDEALELLTTALPVE